MKLPEDFIKDLSCHLSKEELDSFIFAMTETEQTTCVRMNTSKGMTENNLPQSADGNKIPCSEIGWNKATGRYLHERPNFTLDPLLHAGCYYVQEASSQFVAHAIRTLVHEPVVALDLCAAPGGKSTALLSSLPEGSQLLSNEIDRRRARILSENITKWGNPNVTVTCNAPKDFRKMTQIFDVILTDVPCSGEGMFRKDEGAITDWSKEKVDNCVSLQREIVETIWPCLKPGGLLIYSTCTFNVHEDEENIAWICQELGGSCIELPIEEAWNIHKPLAGDNACYRFMPHYTKGEGLFLACIRKEEGEEETPEFKIKNTGKKGKQTPSKSKVQLPKVNYQDWVDVKGEVTYTEDGVVSLIPDNHKALHDIISSQNLYILQSGIELGTIKGKDIIPSQALALNTSLKKDAFPRVELDLETALNYLRREAIVLPIDTPTGFVLVCYQGHPLGFVKNMGNRSNNLYPQEWRIRFC